MSLKTDATYGRFTVMQQKQDLESERGADDPLEEEKSPKYDQSKSDQSLSEEESSHEKMNEDDMSLTG